MSKDRPYKSPSILTLLELPTIQVVKILLSNQSNIPPLPIIIITIYLFIFVFLITIITIQFESKTKTHFQNYFFFIVEKNLLKMSLVVNT
jgi:hypothetical protein